VAAASWSVNGRPWLQTRSVVEASHLAIGVVDVVLIGCVQHQEVGVLEQVLARRWPVEVIRIGRMLDDRSSEGLATGPGLP